MGQFGQLELLSTSQFNLRPMLDALTSISSVAWRINNKVLDVVNELFLSRKPYEHLGLVGEKVTFKDFAQLPFNAALDKASLEEVRWFSCVPFSLSMLTLSPTSKGLSQATV